MRFFMALGAEVALVRVQVSLSVGWTSAGCGSAFGCVGSGSHIGYVETSVAVVSSHARASFSLGVVMRPRRLCEGLAVACHCATGLAPRRRRVGAWLASPSHGSVDLPLQPRASHAACANWTLPGSSKTFLVCFPQSVAGRCVREVDTHLACQAAAKTWHHDFWGIALLGPRRGRSRNASGMPCSGRRVIWRRCCASPTPSGGVAECY